MPVGWLFVEKVGSNTDAVGVRWMHCSAFDLDTVQSLTKLLIGAGMPNPKLQLVADKLVHSVEA